MANTFIFDDDDQPDMGSPMPDQGDDDQSPEEGEGGNRTFMILLIVIGAFALISILCIAGYFVLSRPGMPLARVDVGATNVAQTQESLAIQQTQEAQATPTLSPTIEITVTATATPVVVFATETSVEEPTSDPATATVEALQTQLASSQLTSTFQPSPTGSTATAQLARTGFADEVGLPGLVIVTVILLGIILLARRLREAPMQ